MKKKSIALCLAVLMMAAIFAGCNTGGTTTTPAGTTAPGTTSPGTTAPGTTAAPTAPAEPKIFYGWTTTRATWSPHQSGNTTSFLIYGNMVSILSSVDGNDRVEFVPDHLSELPTTDDGGFTWTCKFRDGLKWYEDGTPITSETYMYSMKMLLDPKLANKNAYYLFDPVVVVNARNYFQGNCTWEDVGIKDIGNNTIQFTLEYAAAEIDFIRNICQIIFPVHEGIYEAGMNADRTSTTYGTTLAETPTCGPYYLKDWMPDGYEVYARNDESNLVKMGYYFLDEYNNRYVSENAVRFQLFMNGELDWAALSADNYEPNKNDPRVVKAMSSSVWGIFVNGTSKNKIMQNNDFRKALFYSAPRVAVATEVYVLYKSPNYYVAEGIFVEDGSGQSVKYRDTPQGKAIEAKYSDDDALALELFNKAYEANGNKKITVELTYFDEQEQMKRQGEVCQEKWEGLFGKDRFELKLRAVMPQQAYDNYRVGDYDLGTGVRSANVFNPWASMNVWTTAYTDKYLSGFENEEFDKLFFDTVYGDLLNDAEGRIDALAKMEDMLLDYVAFIPTMQNDNSWLVQEWVQLPTYTFLPFVSYGFAQSDIIPN